MDPMQTNAACRDSSIKTLVGDPSTISASILTCSRMAWRAADAERSTVSPYSISRLFSPAGSPGCRSGIAWMRRSGMPRPTASATAHLAAFTAAPEPSIPTTTRFRAWFISSSGLKGKGTGKPGPVTDRLYETSTTFRQGRLAPALRKMVTCVGCA